MRVHAYTPSESDLFHIMIWRLYGRRDSCYYQNVLEIESSFVEG